MPKREREPITRVHMHIFSADLEKLHLLYGDTVGVSKAVREIVRTFIKRQIDNKVDSALSREPVNE